MHKAFPGAAQTRLATWHFWLYQLAVPVMLAALACLLLGVTAAGPVLGIASAVVFVSVLLFWWAIFRARNTTPSQ